MSLPSSSSETTPEPLSETPESLPVDRTVRLRALLREILETVILTVIIYLAVNFATGRYRVEGDSMLPTVHPDEYVLLDKVSYMIGEPERGDIVVFHYPFGTERDFIKRVIGLPGDTVAITNGVVTVNGQPLDEPYISAPPRSPDNTWTLGPDQFFVMGDNRNNSSDSRSWGPLERKYLVGRALVVYWPLSAWRVVPHYDYTVSADSSQ